MQGVLYTGQHDFKNITRFIFDILLYNKPLWLMQHMTVTTYIETGLSTYIEPHDMILILSFITSDWCNCLH